MDNSFEIHSSRLFKMSSLIRRLNNLNKLPYSLDIPDDIIDSSTVSELVDYVISKYYA